MNDALVEVRHVALVGCKHGMIEVVMGGFGGRCGRQLQRLIEDIGQIEGSGGRPRLAWAALRGLCGTGEAIVGGGGGAVEGLAAGV